MPTSTSLEETFRFSQRRPRRPVGESGAISLQLSRRLLRQLHGAVSVATRAADAQKWLAAGAIASLRDLPLGKKFVKAVAQLRVTPNATTDDLHIAVPPLAGQRALPSSQGDAGPSKRVPGREGRWTGWRRFEPS